MDILLYTGIYEWTAERFINQLNAAGNAAVDILINCMGGDPLSAYGMIAKLKEHPGTKRSKVHGQAKSMAAFFLCYTEDNEALDVSEFMFHRAAYSSWVERNKDLMTEEAKASLKRTNDDLRRAMEAKIDVAKFEQITGVSLDRLFSLDERIDVPLTAQQAKEIGLIQRINKITPELRASIEGNMMRIAAEATGLPIVPPAPAPIPTTTKKNTAMTLEELKAQHPEVYKEAMTAGINQERDRVGSWMPFMEIDAEAVAKGIKEGTTISQTQMSEFALKNFSKQALEKAKEANAPEVETPEADDKTDAQKNIEAFGAALDKELGVKK